MAVCRSNELLLLLALVTAEARPGAPLAADDRKANVDRATSRAAASLGRLAAAGARMLSRREGTIESLPAPDEADLPEGARGTEVFPPCPEVSTLGETAAVVMLCSSALSVLVTLGTTLSAYRGFGRRRRRAPSVACRSRRSRGLAPAYDPNVAPSSASGAGGAPGYLADDELRAGAELVLLRDSLEAPMTDCCEVNCKLKTGHVSHEMFRARRLASSSRDMPQVTRGSGRRDMLWVTCGLWVKSPQAHVPGEPLDLGS